MAIDFTKTPQEILIDLINADNGTTLTPDQLLFDPPIAQPSTAVRNTSITATPSPTSGLTGKVTLFYNRYSLAFVPEDKSVDFVVIAQSHLRDIIPEFNSRYGVNLTADDFVDGPLPVLLPQTSGVVALNAAPESFVYIGSLNLTIIDNNTTSNFPSDTFISSFHTLLTDIYPTLSTLSA